MVWIGAVGAAVTFADELDRVLMVIRPVPRLTSAPMSADVVRRPTPLPTDAVVRGAVLDLIADPNRVGRSRELRRV